MHVEALLHIVWLLQWDPGTAQIASTGRDSSALVPLGKPSQIIKFQACLQGTKSYKKHERLTPT